MKIYTKLSKTNLQNIFDQLIDCNLAKISCHADKVVYLFLKENDKSFELECLYSPYSIFLQKYMNEIIFDGRRRCNSIVNKINVEFRDNRDVNYIELEVQNGESVYKLYCDLCFCGKSFILTDNLKPEVWELEDCQIAEYTIAICG
jgi:hypothetical protein